MVDARLDPPRTYTGLGKTHLTLREHQERCAQHGWRLLTEEEARRLGHPEDQVKAWFASQPAPRPPPGSRHSSAVWVEVHDGETVVYQGDAARPVLTLPWETTDTAVIQAALIGVQAGITMVDAAITRKIRGTA